MEGSGSRYVVGGGGQSSLNIVSLYTLLSALMVTVKSFYCASLFNQSLYLACFKYNASKYRQVYTTYEG